MDNVATELGAVIDALANPEYYALRQLFELI